MHWLMLIVAGLFEAAFAYCLGRAKLAGGMEMYGWYAGFAVSLLVSMVLLIRATQVLPIGTAYAVWTGIGAVGTAVLGIIAFGEPATVHRLLFLITLIASIVGLKVVSE